MKTYVFFCMYLKHTLLNIYQSKDCLKQKLWKKLSTFYTLITSRMVFKIVEQI
jgi:hypothetical protein